MSKQPLYDGRDLEVLAAMPRYYAWIMSHFQPHLGTRVLEIGAGTGVISERIRPYVTSLELVEPSPNLCSVLRQRFFGDDRVTVRAVTLESYLSDDSGGQFDAVVLVNVLEHIENDATALSKLRTRLSKGGRLLLFVPAMPFLYSALDRRFGHFRRYTLPDLGRLFDSSGYRIITARYMDILGIAPWWVVNTLCGMTDFNPHLVKLYDTLGIPVTRIFENIFCPPVGKNILVVAECEES